jgi:hypothetical protein
MPIPHLMILLSFSPSTRSRPNVASPEDFSIDNHLMINLIHAGGIGLGRSFHLRFPESTITDRQGRLLCRRLERIFYVIGSIYLKFTRIQMNDCTLSTYPELWQSLRRRANGDWPEWRINGLYQRSCTLGSDCNIHICLTSLADWSRLPARISGTAIQDGVTNWPATGSD